MSNDEMLKRIEELEYKVACQDKYIRENDMRVRILNDWLYRVEEAAGIKLVEYNDVPMFRMKTEELCKTCKYYNCDHLCLYCKRYSWLDYECECDTCAVCVDYKEKEQLIVKKPAGEIKEG